MFVHSQAERCTHADKLGVMNNATVCADKKATLLEQVQIPADCIARYIEQRHEFGNRDLSMLLNKFDQAVLTHGCQCVAVRLRIALGMVTESLYAMANSLQLWLDNATTRRSRWRLRS